MPLFGLGLTWESRDHNSSLFAIVVTEGKLRSAPEAWEKCPFMIEFIAYVPYENLKLLLTSLNVQIVQSFKDLNYQIVEQLPHLRHLTDKYMGLKY